MPVEAPEWCVDRRKGRKGSRGSPPAGSKPASTSDLSSVSSQQVETTFMALGGVGEVAARELAEWVSSGAFVDDEEGFLFPPIADKGQRSAIHGAVRGLLSPLVSDAMPMGAGAEASDGVGMVIRVRAPQHSSDPRR